MRDGPQAVFGAIRATENIQNAIHGTGTTVVDADNSGMRIGGPDHHRVGLTRQAEIVGELALSGEKAAVLLAPQGAANRLESYGFD